MLQIIQLGLATPQSLTPHFDQRVSLGLSYHPLRKQVSLLENERRSLMSRGLVGSQVLVSACWSLSFSRLDIDAQALGSLSDITSLSSQERRAFACGLGGQDASPASEGKCLRERQAREGPGP